MLSSVFFFVSIRSRAHKAIHLLPLSSLACGSGKGGVTTLKSSLVVFFFYIFIYCDMCTKNECSEENLELVTLSPQNNNHTIKQNDGRQFDLNQKNLTAFLAEAQFFFLCDNLFLHFHTAGVSWAVSSLLFDHVRVQTRECVHAYHLLCCCGCYLRRVSSLQPRNQSKVQSVFLACMRARGVVGGNACGRCARACFDEVIDGAKWFPEKFYRCASACVCVWSVSVCMCVLMCHF